LRIPPGRPEGKLRQEYNWVAALLQEAGSTRLNCLGTAGAALAGSVLFFLITNFGVWWFQSLYPHTLDGLIACYVAAIPFFRNTLLGDLLYTAVLFGGFALLEMRFSALRAPVTPAHALNA